MSFEISWDKFLLLHLFLPSPPFLLDLYKGVFLQAKNIFFWPMKEKKNGKTAHVFLQVSRYFPMTFISNFHKWCHGSLVCYVANTPICPSDTTTQRTISSFLLSEVIPVLCGHWCHTHTHKMDIFDVVILQIYCIFQMLMSDVEITILNFIAPP